MNAQTKNSLLPCCWCGSPVGRLHISVAAPAVAVGRPHRWLFCGLLCLFGWCAAERSSLVPP
ncbi:MAG: hypothetical protein WAN35_04285 [Terracidiphilus sp.]